MDREGDKHLAGRDLNDGEFAAELGFRRQPPPDQTVRPAFHATRNPTGDGRPRRGRNPRIRQATFDRAGVHVHRDRNRTAIWVASLYDRTVHTVTVTVTEDTKSHKLAASVASPTAKPAKRKHPLPEHVPAGERHVRTRGQEEPDRTRAEGQ